MANLTITVDRQTLTRARIRALEDGTSVNAIPRDYLERYAGGGGARMRSSSSVGWPWPARPAAVPAGDP